MSDVEKVREAIKLSGDEHLAAMVAELDNSELEAVIKAVKNSSEDD